MSDLRWSDCDDMAYRGKYMEALLCRTSKLNDHAHETDTRLTRVEAHINWFGWATTALGILATGITLWRSLHGG